MPRLAYDPDVICVVPIGRVLPRALERVVEWLRAEFGLPVVIGKLPIDPAGAFDPARGQYDSTLLLRELREHCASRSVRVLGLTEVDLCNAVLSFVFGQAQLDGNVAISSSFRLRDAAGGTPDDPGRLHDRLTKVILHELGHVFGLGHCERDDCVMCAAKSVADLDRKRGEYCLSCLAKLGWEIRRRARFAATDDDGATRAA